MNVIVVVTAKVNMNNPESAQKYFQGAGKLIGEVGGNVIKKATVLKNIAGTTDYDRVVLFEFPSSEAVDQVFTSDAYNELIPARDEAFYSISISLAAQA
jgi:uncharacterized protein (DUF1330 family)